MSYPSDETEDGIDIFCNDEQFLNALMLISSTVAGICISVNDVQSSKAPEHISCTEYGIITFCKDDQPLKKLFPIVFVNEGIVISVKYL